MDPTSNKQIKYVDLITTNSLIFRNVNVNAQLILWKNGRILNESKLNLVDPDFYRRTGNYLKFLALNYFKRRKKRIPGKTVWVVNEWAFNYYHWFVDALPKILSTRLDKQTFVVVMPASFRRLPYHEDSLKMLDVRWQYFDDVTERVSCEELYLPINVSIDWTANPVYIQKLRVLLLANIPAHRGKGRLLYVTRRNAEKRKVANDNEVIALLEPLGFEVVEFEKMNFIEQVTTCNAASAMIGLHGAGLTNMLFMSEGKTIVELRRENEDTLCFQHLSEALKMNYHFLVCKNLGNDRYNSDFLVNIEELRKMVESLFSR